jgi:hypothetical protein
MQGWITYQQGKFLLCFTQQRTEVIFGFGFLTHQMGDIRSVVCVALLSALGAQTKAIKSEIHVKRKKKQEHA